MFLNFSMLRKFSEILKKVEARRDAQVVQNRAKAFDALSNEMQRGLPSEKNICDLFENLKQQYTVTARKGFFRRRVSTIDYNAMKIDSQAFIGGINRSVANGNTTPFSKFVDFAQIRDDKSKEFLDFCVACGANMDVAQYKDYTPCEQIVGNGMAKKARAISKTRIKHRKVISEESISSMLENVFSKTAVNGKNQNRRESEETFDIFNSANLSIKVLNEMDKAGELGVDKIREFAKEFISYSPKSVGVKGNTACFDEIFGESGLDLAAGPDGSDKLLEVLNNCGISAEFVDRFKEKRDIVEKASINFERENKMGWREEVKQEIKVNDNLVNKREEENKVKQGENSVSRTDSDISVGSREEGEQKIEIKVNDGKAVRENNQFDNKEVVDALQEARAVIKNAGVKLSNNPFVKKDMELRREPNKGDGRAVG